MEVLCEADDLYPRAGFDDKRRAPPYFDDSAKGVCPRGGLRGGRHTDPRREALLGLDGLEMGRLGIKPFFMMLRCGDNGYLDVLVAGPGKICQLDVKGGLLSSCDCL